MSKLSTPLELHTAPQQEVEGGTATKNAPLRPLLISGSIRTTEVPTKRSARRRRRRRARRGGSLPTGEASTGARPPHAPPPSRPPALHGRAVGGRGKRRAPPTRTKNPVVGGRFRQAVAGAELVDGGTGSRLPSRDHGAWRKVGEQGEERGHRKEARGPTGRRPQAQPSSRLEDRRAV
jgi:hypothetical protein